MINKLVNEFECKLIELTKLEFEAGMLKLNVAVCYQVSQDSLININERIERLKLFNS